MNNQNSDSVAWFLLLVVWGRLVRRLPFAASNCIELQKTKAANGIQRAARLSGRLSSLLDQLTFSRLLAAASLRVTVRFTGQHVTSQRSAAKLRSNSFI